MSGSSLKGEIGGEIESVMPERILWNKILEMMVPMKCRFYTRVTSLLGSKDEFQSICNCLSIIKMFSLVTKKKNQNCGSEVFWRGKVVSGKTGDLI